MIDDWEATYESAVHVKYDGPGLSLSLGGYSILQVSTDVPVSRMLLLKELRLVAVGGLLLVNDW